MKCLKRFCKYNKKGKCTNEILSELNVLGAKLLNCTEYKIKGR